MIGYLIKTTVKHLQILFAFVHSIVFSGAFIGQFLPIQVLVVRDKGMYETKHRDLVCGSRSTERWHHCFR